MEKLGITIELILLVWALIVLYQINSQLNALKKEQKRHNNIQSVILEQVDEINQKV